MSDADQSESPLVDELTGLGGRTYLYQALQEELKRYESSRKPLSVFVLDIDELERINETYGQRGGDEALVKVAALVRSNVKSSDVVCRYGGDEFAVVLTDVDKQTAKIVAKRVADAVSSQEMEVLGKPLRITLSAGVATFPEDGQDAAVLLDCAEKALIAGKSAGGTPSEDGQKY